MKKLPTNRKLHAVGNLAEIKKTQWMVRALETSIRELGENLIETSSRLSSLEDKNSPENAHYLFLAARVAVLEKKSGWKKGEVKKK